MPHGRTRTADKGGQRHSKPPWISEYPRVVIATSLVACLAPFLNKAVHTDDVLFVYAARWIQKHPINFFGGEINWWTSITPMWVANWNPPLFSYFLAAVGAVLGWSEFALHIGSLAVAILTALGIYSLAERWCERPLLATLVAVLAPAFLVSSTTLMSDIMSLGFWVWAVLLWDRATTNPHWEQFAIAGALAGLACLSKYSVVTLLPLLPIISMIRTRKAGLWVVGLLIPLAVMIAYELVTAHLYGRGLFFAAIHYSKTAPTQLSAGWEARRIMNLSFAGGALLPLLFFAPALWRRSAFVAGALIVPAILFVAFRFMNQVVLNPGGPRFMSNWKFVGQAVVLSTSALHFFLLVVAEGWQRRDHTTRILILWIGGVLVFATILNWTINVRSFLPLVPAAAILMTRRLDAMRPERLREGHLIFPLAPAALLTLGVALADYQSAGAARSAAIQITTKYKERGLWFQGHGAFQYYMEAGGARALDVERSVFEPEDIVVVPENGIIAPLPDDVLGWVERFRYRTSRWIRVMGGDADGAAGFHTAIVGPLPFAFGKPTFENYFVLKTFARARFVSVPANPEDVREGGVPSLAYVSTKVDKRPSYAVKPETMQRIRAARELAVQGDVQEALRRYNEILSEEPDNPVALNDAAWFLATTERPDIRNVPLAVRMASRAVSLTDHRQIEFISALATALAESRQFEQAIEVSQIAEALALVTGHPDVVEFNRKMTAYYSAGIPTSAIGTIGGAVPAVPER